MADGAAEFNPEDYVPDEDDAVDVYQAQVIEQGPPDEVVFLLVIAMALEAITTGEKVKDVGVHIYNQCRLAIAEKRVNVKLKSQLDKREHLFQPHHKLGDIQQATLDRVSAKYFPTKTTDEKVKAVLNAAQSLKAFSRGTAGAVYARKAKQLPSGTYDDEAILEEIAKTNMLNLIEANFKKAVNKDLATWKKEKPENQNASLADKKKKEKEIYDVRKKFYDLKKAKWADISTSAEMVVFTICGLPGLDFICLRAIAGAGPPPPKDAATRRAAGDENGNPNASKKGPAVMEMGQEFVAVEKKKMDLKERVAFVLEQKNDLANVKELIQDMEDANETDQAEYAELKEQKKLILKRKRPSPVIDPTPQQEAGGRGGPREEHTPVVNMEL